MLQRKPVGPMPADPGVVHDGLKPSFGVFHLTMMGIGATIGTGIFIILTQAVPVAGPAVVLSFLVAGLVAGLTALCYAELASAVPVSGSSYSYAYATLGEVVAVGVAGCLLLEYGVSAAAVAVGWSEYLNELLGNLTGWTIPQALSASPEAGGVVNLPAMLLIGMVTMLLVRGASESALVNTILVFMKTGVLVMFVAIGAAAWNTGNFVPFAPSGSSGVMAASGVIFFSYIGLDAISTAGTEVRNPKRDMPIAIISALVVVTVVYILVAVVAVGAQPAGEFTGQEAGLAAILERVTGSSWPASVLAAGAVASIFSCVLVTMYGQTRILFSISRDGLLPPVFGKVDPRTMTPVNNAVVVGTIVALLAGLLPINFLAEMTSIGTLTAFLVVSIGVMVLRRTAPELPRGFRVPLYPVIPVLSVLGCLWIIKDLRAVTIYVFVIWVSVVMVGYFAYGIRHSHLRHPAPDAALVPAPSPSAPSAGD